MSEPKDDSGKMIEGPFIVPLNFTIAVRGDVDSPGGHLVVDRLTRQLVGHNGTRLGPTLSIQLSLHRIRPVTTNHREVVKLDCLEQDLLQIDVERCKSV